MLPLVEFAPRKRPDGSYAPGKHDMTSWLELCHEPDISGVNSDRPFVKLHMNGAGPHKVRDLVTVYDMVMSPPKFDADGKINLRGKLAEAIARAHTEYLFEKCVMSRC